MPVPTRGDIEDSTNTTATQRTIFADLRDSVAGSGKLYESATEYSLNDLAIGSNGLLYISQVNTNTGNDPVSDGGTNWKLITADGAIPLTYDNDTTSYIVNTLPSGAISETGSNANGEYVKYADGTLICWSAGTLGTTLVNVADGNIYKGSGLTWTFPHAFIDANYQCFGDEGSSTSTWLSFSAFATSSVSLIGMCGRNLATSARNFEAAAVGKWK